MQDAEASSVLFLAVGLGGQAPVVESGVVRHPVFKLVAAANTKTTVDKNGFLQVTYEQSGLQLVQILGGNCSAHNFRCVGILKLEEFHFLLLVVVKEPIGADGKLAVHGVALQQVSRALVTENGR